MLFRSPTLAANHEESDSVKAAICWYCPGDFPYVLGDPVPVCYEDLLTGEKTSENEALLKEINPMSHVREGVPPFLFFHGDADNVVYHQSSLNLYEKLLNAGVEADYYLLEGAGHAENAFTQEGAVCKIKNGKIVKVIHSDNFENIRDLEATE